MYTDTRPILYYWPYVYIVDFCPTVSKRNATEQKTNVSALKFNLGEFDGLDIGILYS